MYRFGIEERASYIAIACGVTKEKAREMIRADSENIIQFLKSGHAMRLLGLGILKPRTTRITEKFISNIFNTGKTFHLHQSEDYTRIVFRPERGLSDEIKELTLGKPFNTDVEDIYYGGAVEEYEEDEFYENEEYKDDIRRMVEEEWQES